MMMKIVTYVLAALLLVAIGAAAVFYLNTYAPLASDYSKLKESIPALDKAKAELKKLKDEESRQAAWISPAINVLSAGLAPEIGAGKAEVLSADKRVIVNIAEDALFVKDSSVFAQNSPALRDRLAAVLKKDELRSRDIYIGNTTDAVPAQGKGRKKIPPKDARTLAADRSAALIRDFEKNGISQDALIEAAFAPRRPDIGFKLKDHKTIIIIENPPVAPAMATKQAEQPKAAPVSKPASSAAATTTVKPASTIPIQPQPKAR